MSQDIICYNKGCGKRFLEDDNTNDSCCFHPGQPVFHDAYKKWSCCSNKSTDFTTFLNMQGCTSGKHNPNKPVEEPKRKPDKSDREEVIVVKPPDVIKIDRNNIDKSMVPLKINISQSLKRLLENESEDCNGIKEEQSDVVQIGEMCKNNGCKESYSEESKDFYDCKHHPGVPIFHEGLKFWSCCQKKTIEFDHFLSQKGCVTGTHLWKKKDVKKSTCRYDWHQNPTDVYIAFYAKKCKPVLSSIKINPIHLKANILSEQNIYEFDKELGGVVDPTQSVVNMNPSKVEVQLKKAEAHSWSKLFVEEEKKLINKFETVNQSSSVDVSDIDLGDL